MTAGPAEDSPDDRLESWKEIAAYLGRDIRTAQRWEKALGMPVYRFQDLKSGPVYSYKSRLAAWRRDRARQIEAEHAEQTPIGTVRKAASPAAAVPSSSSAAVPAPAPVLERSAATPALPAPAPAAASAPRPHKNPLWRVVAVAAALGSVAGAFIATLIVADRKPVSAEPAMTQVTTNAGEARVTAAEISPDGKLLAYADMDGVVLRKVQSGETVPLNAPKDYRVDRLAWYPDATAVLASGYDAVSGKNSIWRLSVSGGSPQLLRSDARDGSPSPDGQMLAFASGDDSELWTAGPAGENPRRLVPASHGLAFPVSFWSSDGRLLLYQKRHYKPRPLAAPEDLELDYSWSLDALDVASGGVVSSIPNLRIASGCAVRDGRVFIVRQDSPDDRFTYNVWQYVSNPSTGKPLTPVRQVTRFREMHVLEISAPRDGGQVSMLRMTGQPDVYVGDLEWPGPRLIHTRPLTLDQKNDYPQAWSPDGQAVIFESSRIADHYNLFHQRLDQRVPELIVATPGEQAMPQVTPDGKWILYALFPKLGSTDRSLMRVGLKGGTPEQVPLAGPLDEFRCATPGGRRCVLRVTEGREWYAFYELDPLAGKGRELARTRWQRSFLGDWSLTMDGSVIAIPDHDARPARIRLISLDTPSGKAVESVLAVPALNTVRGVRWAADGKGLFVSVEKSLGAALEYVDLQGGSKLIRETAMLTWSVASPDGKHLAYVDRTIDSNVWMLRLH